MHLCLSSESLPVDFSLRLFVCLDPAFSFSFPSLLPVCPFILVCNLLLVRTGSLLFSCQPQCSAFESLLINMTVTLASQLTRHQQTINSSFMFVLCSAGHSYITQIEVCLWKTFAQMAVQPEHFTLPQPPGMNVEKRRSRAKC